MARPPTRKPIVKNSIIQGELEMDHNRGVVYFHAKDGPQAGITIVRVSGLENLVPGSIVDVGGGKATVIPGPPVLRYAIERMREEASNGADVDAKSVPTAEGAAA